MTAYRKYLEQHGYSHFMEVENLRLHYVKLGQGEPVVLLHGLGASTYSWSPVMEGLATHHTVYAFDLKGHGATDKPQDGRYGLHDLTRLIRCALDALGLETFSIVGHSLGGAMSVLLMINPDVAPRVTKAVLINSAGYYPQRLPWFVNLAASPIVPDLIKSALPTSWLANLVLRTCYANPRSISPQTVAEYAAPLALPGGIEAFIAIARDLTHRDYGEEIAKIPTIKTETLILWGALDSVIPLAHAHRFHQELPRSSLEILPQCGHIPPEEEPQATTTILREFLTR